MKLTIDRDIARHATVVGIHIADMSLVDAPARLVKDLEEALTIGEFLRAMGALADYSALGEEEPKTGEAYFRAVQAAVRKAIVRDFGVPPAFVTRHGPPIPADYEVLEPKALPAPMSEEKD